MCIFLQITDRGSGSNREFHPAEGGREWRRRWDCWSDLRPFNLIAVDASVLETPGTRRTEKNLKKRFVRQHFWCRCGKLNLEKKKRDARFFKNSEKNLKKVFNGTGCCLIVSTPAVLCDAGSRSRPFEEKSSSNFFAPKHARTSQPC